MGLSGSGAAGPHHTSHENGGSDEVDATGLTGAGGGGGGSSPLKQTHAYRNAVSVTISNNTLTTITFQAELRDDDGNWASSPNPTRIIISQTDTYDIVGGVQWFDSILTGTFQKVGIYKNGTLLHEYSHAPSSFSLQRVVASGVALTAGDYLELKVTQDSGGNRTISPGQDATFLVATRGGDQSFLPIDTTKALRADSPFGVAQKYTDSINEYGYLSLAGQGNLTIAEADATGAAASLQLQGAFAYLVADDTIYVEPGNGPVVIDSGTGLAILYDNSDPTIYDQAHIYYNETRSRWRQVRAPDGNSTQVWADMIVQGNAPFAYPVNWVPGGTYTTAVNLPANGGAMAIPIHVPAAMVVSNVYIYNTDTTGAREFEANLYFDNWASTAVMAQGSFGGDSYTAASWTASGASLQSASYAGADPVWLQQGIIWLVIRNTHATNTLGVGTLASSGTFSTHNSHMTQTLGTDLGSGAGYDLVTGWTKQTAIPGVVLRGRVLGQSSQW